MNNFRLLMGENNEKGIWYFSSIYKAATAIGVQTNLLKYYIDRSKEYKGWNFEWVDGENIIYKYINPEKI